MFRKPDISFGMSVVSHVFVIVGDDVGYKSKRQRREKNRDMSG